MSTITEIKQALATALEPLRDAIPDIQIHPKWLAACTPPTVDVYEATPFMNGLGFGPNGGYEMFFMVRARVTTADSDAGQDLLSQILEPDTGIIAALVADQTLGGVVDSLSIDEVSGLTDFVEDVAVNGRLLGSQLRVRVLT